MLPSVFNRKSNAIPRSFVDDFFTDSFLPKFVDWNWNHTDASTPAVNVEENDKEFLIDVAAPGLDKQDFKVNIDNNVLTISSQKESKNEENRDGYLRREFNYSSFSRAFTLPENTEASKIKASHKNGVLSISIPKSEIKAKQTTEIKIS